MILLFFSFFIFICPVICSAFVCEFDHPLQGGRVIHFTFGFHVFLAVQIDLLITGIIYYVTSMYVCQVLSVR